MPIPIEARAIPASLHAPRLVIERPHTLAEAPARLAAIALLVAAAGSLGLLAHLRLGMRA